MKNSTSELNQAYEICRKETQKWAKTFYLGTLLLPLEKRKAIWAIYVWCRRTDEIMDSLEASTKTQMNFQIIWIHGKKIQRMSSREILNLN